MIELQRLPDRISGKQSTGEICCSKENSYVFCSCMYIVYDNLIYCWTCKCWMQRRVVQTMFQPVSGGKVWLSSPSSQMCKH